MPTIPASLINTRGPEWQIASLDGTTPAGGGAGAGGARQSTFGGVLSEQLNALQQTQDTAATEATKVATGQATDPTQAVMAIERARLSMQLAAQIRNKTVEAVQDVMRTQV